VYLEFSSGYVRELDEIGKQCSGYCKFSVTKIISMKRTDLISAIFTISNGLEKSVRNTTVTEVNKMYCFRRPSTDERIAGKDVARCRLDVMKARTVLTA